MHNYCILIYSENSNWSNFFWEINSEAPREGDIYKEREQKMTGCIGIIINSVNKENIHWYFKITICFQRCGLIHILSVLRQCGSYY